MIETSKDILYLAIALAVLSLAGFSSWAIYYFARIMQQGFKIAQEMRDRISKVDELIRTIKEKVENSSSYLLLIGEGVKKLVEVIRERTQSKTNKKTDQDREDQ